MQIGLLSVVTPAFNEEDSIVPFRDAIAALALPVDYEIVFVDDGSRDATLERIRGLADADGRVRYVSFSRNFGKEAALLAGLEHARGDAVVTMDVDLQHSPALLTEMLRALVEEGFDAVATRRTDRSGEPALRSWCAHRFYALMNRFSDVPLVDGSMDFRMMTRRVVDEVLRLQEANRFTKGIYQWVGFRTKWLETGNVARVTGESKWSLWSLFAYSVRGLLAFSTAPLQLASILGFVCCTCSFVYMTFVFFKWLVCGDPAAGWPTLICVVLLLGGLQLFVIGILGTYVAGVYREVKRRPAYIVRESR